MTADTYVPRRLRAAESTEDGAVVFEEAHAHDAGEIFRVFGREPVPPTHSADRLFHRNPVTGKEVRIGCPCRFALLCS